jgi:hypothetical protein
MAPPSQELEPPINPERFKCLPVDVSLRPSSLSKSLIHMANPPFT